MPRYDYRCPVCHTVYEIEHGMKEKPEILCPTCKVPTMRVFDTSGIVLKGSGFYNTDQRGHSGSTEATSGATHDHAASQSSASPDATSAPSASSDSTAGTPAPSSASNE